MRSISILFNTFQLSLLSLVAQESPEARFGDYGFPIFHSLKHVCGGHVTGSPPKPTAITWDAFATEEKVEEVVAYYRNKIGDTGMARDGHGATWRFPLGATQPERVLEIASPTKEGPWRHCDSQVLATTRCVVTVSRATRR